MHTLAAFYESLNEAGAATDVAAVIDQHIRVEGDNIIVPPVYNKMFGATAISGTNPVRTELHSPSIDQLHPYQISPINAVLVPTGNEVHDLHPESLLVLEPNEQLSCQNTGTPGGAELHGAVIYLTDKEINPVRGRFTSLRFQVTVTMVAGVWCFAPINLIDRLPVDRYTIVGARLVCVAAIAARFVIPGVLPRPGFPCSANVSVPIIDMFRNGKLGVWAEFDQLNLPDIELLGAAAPGAATYEGVMDVIVK